MNRYWKKIKKFGKRYSIEIAVLGFIIAILGLTVSLSFGVPWKSILAIFEEGADIEVYMIKKYADVSYPTNFMGLEDMPTLCSGELPKNNKRMALDYTCGERLISEIAFYVPNKYNRMDKIMNCGIGGKGCDTCNYYFIFLRNYGEDYEGEIELELNSSTKDVEILDDKMPGVEIDKGGIPGRRRVLVKFDKLIQGKELASIALLRTERSEELSLLDCSIEGKGTCEIYNGVQKMWVIPKNIDKIIFDDIGEVLLPPIEKEHQAFLLNPYTKEFEESHGGVFFDKPCENFSV